MQQNDALFGYSGFVGSNLAAQRVFKHRFNSTNSLLSAGMKFDQVIFSAARAEKWRANQDPETDRKHIEELMTILDNIEAEEFILISTVDVYKHPQAVSESSEINADGLHPYGLHRLQLENFVRSRFRKFMILRLPGLFGPGLKKNIIFDLMNNNELEKIRPDSQVQYYDVSNLWRHIEQLRKHELELVNLVAEPIDSGHLAEQIFGKTLVAGDSDVPAPRYDVWTEYSEIFGAKGNYLFSAEQSLNRIDRFVKKSVR